MKKVSVTDIAFTILVIALVAFTQEHIITGDQFMKMVEVAFMFYFVKKGYDSATKQKEVGTNNP